MPCYDPPRMSERNSSTFRGDSLTAGAVFLLALTVRLLYIHDIQSAGLSSFLRLDPLYYHEWAVRIAAGDWIGRDVFEMSPLYPYTLAAVYRVFGESLIAPRIMQALLGALTCAGLFLLGRRLFGRAAGAVAGTMLAVYGPAIYYDGQINKTSLAVALSLGFAGAAVISEGRRPGWLAVSGLLLGLAALVHENVNVAAPILLAWAAWPREADTWKRCASRAAVFVAGYAAAVLPVTIRNAAVSGEWVLITSAGGENFYTGNNELASGRYAPPPFVRPDPFFEHEDFRREAARRAGRELTRKEASRFWWGQGIRFILEDPGRWVLLLWDKLGVFFNAFERPDNFSYYNFRLFSPTLSLPLLSFGIVMPLAVVGIWLSAPRWRELLPLYAVAGAYVVSALIFFTQSRYRMPAVPFFVLFAAHGALSMAGLFRERRAGAGGAVLAALLCAFFFVNRDPGNGPVFHAQNEAILGELYFNADRLDDAAAAFRRGIDRLAPMAADGDPTLARIVGAANYGLGLTEARRGNEDAAEQALRIAAACPDADVRADALLELADLFERRGNIAAMAEALGQAEIASPGNASLRVRRAQALYEMGRLADSLAEAEHVIAQSPPPPPADLADAFYTLAMIRIDHGEEDAGRAALRRTIDLNPAHPRASWIRRKLGLPEGPAR